MRDRELVSFQELLHRREKVGGWDHFDNPTRCPARPIHPIFIAPTGEFLHSAVSPNEKQPMTNSTTVRSAKRKLRKEVLERLSGMEGSNRSLQSLALLDALEKLPEISRAASVMAFWPMDLEPDLSRLLDGLVAGGVQVVLPVITRFEPVSETGGPRMVARPYSSADALVTNHWGLREPIGAEIQPESLDIVLIPAVAISRSGDRLGHGRAYYDEFLTKATRALVVAPIFREQLVQSLPVESHDRPVDLIITPDEVIRITTRA